MSALRSPGIPSGASRADPASAYNTKSELIPISRSGTGGEELRMVFKSWGGCSRGVRGKAGGDAEVPLCKLPDLLETKSLVVNDLTCLLF